jgi:hypothetical protein
MPFQRTVAAEGLALLAAIILLAAIYVGCYFATVYQGDPMAGNPHLGAFIGARYRIFGSSVYPIFRPIHQIDRDLLRPAYWAGIAHSK